MSISYWQDQSNDSPINFDITIIGAGMAGLSTLYWLLKEDPQLNICIIDKGSIGSGATGKNAGFITCGSVEHFNRLVETHGPTKALEIWQFSEKNLELLCEEIITDNFDSLQFENKGSFSLASTGKEFNELKKSAQLMGQMKIPIEVLNENEISKRLHTQGFIGGIKYIGDASVHPLKLLYKIKSQSIALNKKISFFENEEVFNIEQDQNKKIISTPSYKISSDIVIYTTNAYSHLLEPYFKDKVFPTRGQILTTEALPPLLEGPCYANFVLDYFRQLPTGELIIGGFRQLQKDTEVGFSDEITPVIQKALEDFIQTYLPFAKEKKITHRWSGIMGFSVDGQPMIGALPYDSQSFFSVGFTAHGLGLCFHSAKCLVDMMFGRDIPDFISAKRL